MSQSLLKPGMFEAPATTEEEGNPQTRGLRNLLREGQCLYADTFHNAGWYNKRGEKLGWGDLSSFMLREIPGLLPAGEVFILLSEAASFWELPKGLNPGAPGLDYIVSKMVAIATPQGWYLRIGKHDSNKLHLQKCYVRGDESLPAQWVNEEWVTQLLTTANTMEVGEGYVICDVEHPTKVEELLPGLLTVGDGWCSSHPDQKQADGRWKLYTHIHIHKHGGPVVL